MSRWILGVTLMLSASFARAASPAEPAALLEQLAQIHLDKTKIYSVRDISLNRDALSISLNRGALAFTEALDGKVTGAVFIGSGDLLLIPQDRAERQQLFRFTKSALLNEHFETAIFRFTDDSYDEILKQHQQHAIEEVDPDARQELLRWESEIQRRATYLNTQLLADMLSTVHRPFFLAQIEGAQFGWFDAVYDERRTEEIFVQQRTTLSLAPLVWTSFNKRSESSDPERYAHENKTVFDILAAGVDGKSMTLIMRADGERVLELPALSATVARIALEGGPDLFFSQQEGALAVVLPEPTKAGEQVVLQLEYAGELTEPVRIRTTVRPDAVAPASYRDQWIIDGVAAYAATGGSPEALAASRTALLEESPEGGSYESRGSVSLGIRMAQPLVTAGYARALANKGLWIVHMLKNILLTSSEGEDTFTRFLADMGTQFRGRSISMYDFKNLAEKHAGKSLDWFFDSWVFETGIPEYKLDYKIEAAGGEFAVSGTIEQSGVPPTFEMPVPVYADDVVLGNVTVSVDPGEFRFVVPTRPAQIYLDPKDTILKR